MTLATMTKEETNKANREQCKHIADTLENVAIGCLYKCSECGELVDISENEELEETIFSGESVCPMCGEHAEFEQVDMIDWLGDALDFDFIIGSDREYKGCRVMVAFGGPTIYVDTIARSVDLYWWTDRASYPLSAYACEELDRAMEMVYSC